MATYAPSKDINRMTDEERAQHYEAVCAALGFDPALQLLKYTLMDKGDGSGERHLVLYATKGATDALRDINNIGIDTMTDKVIGGAVIFTASGLNSKGRRDIAVGSATIEGKHGKTLENAFMIAQTRASRRLTLQFAGCGLLDESEINDDKTVSLITATVPLAEIGKPVPSASIEAGKDITLPTPSASGIVLPNAPSIAAIQIPAAAPTAISIEPIDEKRLPNPAAGLKAVAPNIMAAPDAVPPPTPVAQENAAVGPTTEQITTRRKRRTKAEMDAARAAETAAKPEVVSAAPPDPKPFSPEQTVSVAIDPLVHQAAKESTVATMTSETPGASPEVVAQPANDPNRTVPIIGTSTTAEQMKVFVDRLAWFRDQCTANGMIPSQGLGPSKKVREFCKIINRGSDLNNLSVEQWENTFRFLNETIEKHGWKELIQFMEQQIGAISGQATA